MTFSLFNLIDADLTDKEFGEKFGEGFGIKFGIIRLLLGLHENQVGGGAGADEKAFTDKGIQLG